MRLAAVLAATLAPLLAATAARAQGAVEVAPFAGLAWGGGVSDARSGAGSSLDGAATFGVAVDVPIRRDAALEALFSRQRTGASLGDDDGGRLRVTVDHWMVGVRATVPTAAARVRPFVSAYLGLTAFSGPPARVASATRFTAALGAGAVFDVAKRLALRLDARGYAVGAGRSAAVACGGGGCSAAFSGGSTFRGELAAGLALSF